MGTHQVTKSRFPSFGGIVPPLHRYVDIFIPLNTALGDCVVFHADDNYELEYVAQSHGTAGTDAGAVTLDVEKLTGTQAIGGGVSMLATTFNLKGTINSVAVRSGSGLSTIGANRVVAPGNRIALNFSGVLTAVSGLCVTLKLRRRR